MLGDRWNKKTREERRGEGGSVFPRALWERERERERGSVFAQGGFHPSALTTIRLQHAHIERKQRGASLLSPRRNVWTSLTRSPHPPEEQVP